jgi:predicted nucleotidyltransferase
MKAEEVESEIRRILAREAKALSGHRVLLFGSRAMGAARPESDFDLGVLGDEPLNLGAFYHISEKLEEIPTLFRIDWIDLNRSDPRLRKAAESHGCVLYED